MTNYTRGSSPDKLISRRRGPCAGTGSVRIVTILKESAAGMKTEKVCRRHESCTNTFYRWKAKYADMEVSDIRKMKALED